MYVPALNTYVRSVILAGAAVAALGLTTWGGSSPALAFACCVLAAVVLPPIKLRLPGLQGTYSPGFLPVLWALTHCAWAEALVIGCAVAASQSYLNARKRPSLDQAIFNQATLALTVSLCHLSVNWLRGTNLLLAASNSPALLTFTAALYFAFNTAVVSGVLSLVQSKPLKEVAGSWYFWSLPYHLLGAAALSLLVGPGEKVRWEAALLVIALLALIQFYCSLVKGTSEPGIVANSRTLSASARLYVAGIIGLALASGVAGALAVGSVDLFRLACWTAAACAASTCKVKLPRAQQTVSLNFIVLLAGIAELPLPEVMIAAVGAAAVQCLWRPAHKPSAIQVTFNMAALALSTALAWTASHIVLAPGLDGLLIGVLAIAAACLYSANTVLVSGALCLITGESFDLWKRCHFWVFAFYLVGSVAAGLVVSTGRSFGWLMALLIAPAMLLVFVSYRLQVQSAAAPQESTA